VVFVGNIGKGNLQVFNIEEPNVVDGIFELLGKSLLSAGLIKFGEIERDEVCPLEIEFGLWDLCIIRQRTSWEERCVLDCCHNERLALGKSYLAQEPGTNSPWL